MDKIEESRVTVYYIKKNCLCSALDFLSFHMPLRAPVTHDFINLCRLALGGQTVKNLRLLGSKFELDQSQRKSTQVGGQTKRKLNASPKLASTCKSVWPEASRHYLVSSSHFVWSSQPE